MSAPTRACPGCGAPSPLEPRYPSRLCGACAALTTDGEGRRLEFANAGLSGGLVWRYADDAQWSEEVGRFECVVSGRRAVVTEGRFGGVVVQIATSDEPADR